MKLDIKKLASKITVDGFLFGLAWMIAAGVLILWAYEQFLYAAKW